MKARAAFWLALAVAVLVFLIYYRGPIVNYAAQYTVRGIRNNNPGNLEKTTIPWRGKVPHARNTDARFEQFEDAEGVPGHIWGIRAMYMDIRGDIFKDGLDTIAKLITSYAPPLKDGKVDNDTAAYIAAVSRALGKSATAKLTADDVLPLLKAITKHENRVNPYPDADFRRAMALA